MCDGGVSEHSSSEPTELHAISHYVLILWLSALQFTDNYLSTMLVITFSALVEQNKNSKLKTEYTWNEFIQEPQVLSFHFLSDYCICFAEPFMQSGRGDPLPQVCSNPKS